MFRLNTTFLSVMWLLCAFPCGAMATLPPLFASREIESTDLKSFPKWQGVMTRSKVESRPWQGCASGRCAEAFWHGLAVYLAASAKKPEQLAQVNQYLNSVLYVQDIVNWGLSDYWASPLQFLLRNGDCEDYAIAKYIALKAAGWPPENMRIVVLQDNNLNILHSVLAVALNGKNYILDNQIAQLVTDNAIHHYQPIFSINETRWWRHLPR
jgi:predicted transglutaminase-like cysteine proteinase